MRPGYAVRFYSSAKHAMETVSPAVTIPSRVKSYGEIPGPKPLPLLGNTWRFIPYIGGYRIEDVDKVSLMLRKRYGDIVRISGILGRPDIVFLFDAAEVERIFRSEEVMPFRPSMPSLNYYKHVLRKSFFGEYAGIIAVHGEQWYKFRTKVQQTMLQPKMARLYINSIAETADAFVKRIRRIADENDEVPGQFLNEIHKWSLESIARIALDVRLGCLEESSDETQELIDAINTVFKNVGKLELKIPFWRVFNTPTWVKYVNALDTIKRTTEKHTLRAFERLSKTDGRCRPDSSLLERILLQNPNNPEIATILAFDMFFVGIDTTSAAVASTLYQLSLHQEKQDILHREVTKSLAAGPLTSQSLEQMPYLRACIKETLRLYPVVIGNGRCMMKDTEISGYVVPKGLVYTIDSHCTNNIHTQNSVLPLRSVHKSLCRVQVVFQHYVMSNSERYFDSPKEFMPERWMNSSKKKCHPFASLPFGYGKRMCLGRRFADLELQILIIKIVEAYKIEYHYPKLEYSVNPLFIPQGPLKFKFVRR